MNISFGNEYKKVFMRERMKPENEINFHFIENPMMKTENCGEKKKSNLIRVKRFLSAFFSQMFNELASLLLGKRQQSLKTKSYQEACDQLHHEVRNFFTSNIKVTECYNETL